MLQDTVNYRKDRKILLSQFPNKEGMGWPTYLIVNNPDDDFNVIGELKGGMSKGDFRSRLLNLLDNNNKWWFESLLIHYNIYHYIDLIINK